MRLYYMHNIINFYVIIPNLHKIYHRPPNGFSCCSFKISYQISQRKVGVIITPSLVSGIVRILKNSSYLLLIRIPHESLYVHTSQKVRLELYREGKGGSAWLLINIITYIEWIKKKPISTYWYFISQKGWSSTDGKDNSDSEERYPVSQQTTS